MHFGASAGRADARRRDAGDVVTSSRSGNAADARPPPRPSGLRPAGPLAVLLAPYIPQRVCSSLAPCQRAWGPAAKCTPYFLTGPKPAAAKTSCFTTETRVVRKNRSAGVSPASEPRQLLLGQHDLCRLEAGDTFFLTTTEGTEISQSNQAATKNFTAETLGAQRKKMTNEK